MTLEQARAFVRNTPTFYTIYRMPKWPENVWSVNVKPPKELPPDAIIHVDAEPTPAGLLF